MKEYAAFDTDGICHFISRDEIEGYTCVEVPENTDINSVWYDHIARLVRDCDIYPHVIEDKYPVGHIVEIPAVPQTTFFVNGEPAEGSFTSTAAGVVWFEAKGRYATKKMIAFNSYVQDRAAAYPTVEEQLDMIYHYGLDGWHDAITAIKQAFPKD